MREEVIKHLIQYMLSMKEDSKKEMHLELADRLAACIEDRAKEMGLSVVTAISDASGHPILVRSMDGAYRGSYDVAVNKTFTAIAFQRSTRELGEVAQPGQPLYGVQFTNQGKIVIFAGGEILRNKGSIIGALGISGGSAEEDGMLAEYGKNLLEEVISCH